MRTAAVVHVTLAACYGLVCWDSRWFPWLAQNIDNRFRTSKDPYLFDTKYADIALAASFVSGLFLLPVLYLWAIRYCTMCYSGAEISALLKDISTLSEATCFLHHLLCQSLPARHATEAAVTSRNPGSDSASSAAGSTTAAIIPSAPAVPDQSELPDSPPASTRVMLQVCSSKSGQSQSSKADLNKAAEKPAGNDAAEQSQNGPLSITEVPDPDQVCKHPSSSTGSFSSAPSQQSKYGITKYEKVASQSAAQSATPVDDNRHALPAALKPRAEAALEASTTMSAYLSARLEAYVHVRTGVYIHGNDDCLAALTL